MNRVAEALDAEYPKWSPGRRVRVVTLHEHLVGHVRSWMLMLLGAVTLVLLIACANVANLMLARRRCGVREMAVRAALGARAAPRARVARRKASCCRCRRGDRRAARVGRRAAMIAWLPAGLPRVANICIDLRVLGAAMAAACTGIVFGIVPALQSSRPDLHDAEGQRPLQGPRAPAASGCAAPWWSRRSRSPSCCSSAPGCSSAASRS